VARRTRASGTTSLTPVNRENAAAPLSSSQATDSRRSLDVESFSDASGEITTVQQISAGAAPFVPKRTLCAVLDLLRPSWGPAHLALTLDAMAHVPALRTSVSASTSRVAHVPGPADAAAVDVQLHARFLSADKRGSQRIALTPVGGFRETVGAPMFSEAGHPAGILGLVCLGLPVCVSLSGIVPTRHPTILLAASTGQAENRPAGPEAPTRSESDGGGQGVESGAPGRSNCREGWGTIG
jgi:hypothetical protein